MNNILDKLAIIFVKWRIRKGWGAGLCETKDLDDYPLLAQKERCSSCKAQEIIEWFENWEELNRRFK